METENKDPENILGSSGNDARTSGNDAGTSRELPGNVPEIVKLLAKKPELRKELIKWVKSEFGFNVESILENYFGELPDKKSKLEDIDMPMREIAENVLQMYDDGYANSQIASYLGIYPSMVARILKSQEGWRSEISGAARKALTQNKKLPWYVRLAARLKLI